MQIYGSQLEALQLHTVYKKLYFTLQVMQESISGTTSHLRYVWTCNEVTLIVPLCCYFLPIPSLSPPHPLPGCCSACGWWSDTGGRERCDPEWGAKGEGKPGKGPLPRCQYLPPGRSPQRSGRRSCQTPLWKVGPCCLPTGSFPRTLILFAWSTSVR